MEFYVWTSINPDHGGKPFVTSIWKVGPFIFTRRSAGFDVAPKFSSEYYARKWAMRQGSNSAWHTVYKPRPFNSDLFHEVIQ